MRLPRLTSLLLVLLLVVAAACGDDDGDAAPDTPDPAPDETPDPDAEVPSGSITIYSGRSEDLVAPILERFTEETGITVEVRYGDTAEMAGAILEEGPNTQADVFWGQDAGALGELSRQGVFTALPDEVVELVPASVRSTAGDWIGISGRARTVIYDTDDFTEDDLPDSILGFTDPEWQGRLGWAPTNGSFQSFVTALRVIIGEDGAREWLEGIQANAPEVYENNRSIVEAAGSGEIDAGFVNHYYVYRYLEEDPNFSAANKYYTDGDPGALVNVAGVGVLEQSGNQAAALALVEFLLGEEGQTFFAEETAELPLVDGVPQDPRLPDFASLQLPDIDLNDLDDLEGTLDLLTDLGIL